MKVLIVDDEKRIVEYLKYILDWKSLGFHKVEGFYSSKGALQYIIDHEPEILITDIRMPELSGLDLAKIIKENELKTKVVILSGYNDFDYAQKAIRLEIADYLLKPVSSKELLPVINRIVEDVEKNENYHYLKNEDSNYFFIEGLATVSNKHEYFYESDYHKIIWSEEILPRFTKLKFFNKYLTILPADYPDIISTNLSDKLTKKNLQEIFYTAQKTTNTFEEDYLFPIELIKYVKEEKWQLVLNTIDSLDSKLVNNCWFQIDLLQVFSEKFPDLLKNIELSEMLEKKLIVNFVSEYIKELMKNENTKKDMNQKMVDKMVSYMKVNYRKEITLDDLSKIVFMHPVTVSRLFKATTGSNISAFLSKIRLEEAARLLEHSNLLVGDIGNLVGYHKAQYFIKLFKQQYGVTPQKYRRNLK
ncbi:response regulator [Enterococcus casseliflavus]|jgi:two-component system response regulator YesN|uniref:response regulator n=1 Tax=Enterococcus casseliflavus TaxID=37734 RepID=UPI001E3E7C4C|nr:response regulator [Enterococcus casseliflavus]MCD4963834.1 response regulator [Enterococcus casseliflavus]